MYSVPGGSVGQVLAAQILGHMAERVAEDARAPGCDAIVDVAGGGSNLGIGACVIPGRSIGAQATVGPGAIVIRDVPDGVTVRGAPARLPELAAVE